MEKFLADESVDFRIVSYLREEGYEVEAILEVNPCISDEDVLQLANELEAILLTEDKDFGELTYRLKKPNQGIVLIRLSDISIDEKIKKIEIVLRNFLNELRGKFTVVSKDKIRDKRTVKNKCIAQHRRSNYALAALGHGAAFGAASKRIK